MAAERTWLAWWRSALAASAGALAYVALYAALGWQVFRTRDA